MDPSNTSKIIEALKKSMNAGPAQHRGAEFHERRPQSFYSASSDGSFQPLTATKDIRITDKPFNRRTIRLFSWNIDVLVPFAEQRMSAALSHLECLVTTSSADVPIVIFLQEMCASDLVQIQQCGWIRDRFHLTDVDNRNWLSEHYGTTTLVDKRLCVESVFRVPWVSKFERDGLFVDVALVDKEGSQSDGCVLRLCNVHLESLVADPPVRPQQMKAAAEYLTEPQVRCALLAGDLNAIQPFDRTLHSENGLKDAYLELGGREDAEEGYTWGHQVPMWMSEKFGFSRMDKILFRGDIEPKYFTRIGAGIEVAAQHVKAMKEAGQLPYVTDHYGVTGCFELAGGWSFSVGTQGSML